MSASSPAATAVGKPAPSTSAIHTAAPPPTRAHSRPAGRVAVGRRWSAPPCSQAEWSPHARSLACPYPPRPSRLRPTDLHIDGGAHHGDGGENCCGTGGAGFAQDARRDSAPTRGARENTTSQAQRVTIRQQAYSTSTTTRVWSVAVAAVFVVSLLLNHVTPVCRTQKRRPQRTRVSWEEVCRCVRNRGAVCVAVACVVARAPLCRVQ